MSTRGRPPRLTPEVAATVRADLAACPWGQRGERYAYWAERLYVCEGTIQRTVQRWAGRVPDNEIQRTFSRGDRVITTECNAVSVA